MCTLTYIPLSPKSYLFTSNRDEMKSRSTAFAPSVHKKEGVSFLAPIDGQALGTWLGANEHSRVVCLLNGAYTPHTPTPPYKHSRGKVVIDALLSENIDDYLLDYDFTNVEPFTLVIIENKINRKIHQFIWDGKIGTKNQLDPEQPHIWSSVTLYNSIQRERRTHQFLNWLSSEQRSNHEILEFHENLDKDIEQISGLSMLRPQFCTVSTTQLLVDEQKVDMCYHDRISTEKDFASLSQKVLNHES
ncbi:NRDE family protein [Flammeovirga yaeyamensis]|nr:NRDE family protein [Flammeovirga yaeyamensis]